MKWLSLIFLLAGFFGHGQISPDPMSLETPNWEVWQTKIPVSGGVRSGIMYELGDVPLDPTTFYVNVPMDHGDNLCVEFNSKDGRYSAKLNYDISRLSSGIHAFGLPTEYKGELARYTPDNVVIIAALSADCVLEPESYLISSWEKPDGVNRFSVYINSSIPSTLIIGKSDGEQQEILFEDLELPTVSYNKKCTVDLGDLKMYSSITISQRLRRFGKVKFNTYSMPIKL